MYALVWHTKTMGLELIKFAKKEKTGLELEKERILRDGISFKHIQENFKTLGELKKLHEEFIKL